MATQRRNSLALYLLLGAIALASLLFHVRSCAQLFPHWFGFQRAAWPFLLGAEDKPHLVLHFMQANAQKAGLQDGDQLIAINAIPVLSESAFADLLSSSKPGSAWRILYRRGSQSADRTARLFLQKTEASNDPISILFYVAMPAFCLALGFWVVSVRLHDVRA